GVTNLEQRVQVGQVLFRLPLPPAVRFEDSRRFNIWNLSSIHNDFTVAEIRFDIEHHPRDHQSEPQLWKSIDLPYSGNGSRANTLRRAFPRHDDVDLDALIAFKFPVEEVATPLCEFLGDQSVRQGSDNLDGAQGSVGINGRTQSGSWCRINVQQKAHHVPTDDPVVTVADHGIGHGLLATITKGVGDTESLYTYSNGLLDFSHQIPFTRRRSTRSAASALSTSPLTSTSQ